MKYFYEILLVLIFVIAVVAFMNQSAIIALCGIVVFFAGCLIEYLINRNKST